MKRLLMFLSLFTFSVVKSQAGYWQQYLAYTIDVQLANMFAPLISASMKKLNLHDFQLQVYDAITVLPIRSAIETKSANFANEKDYALTVYVKTAEWMYLLETTIGANKVDDCFRRYFSDWKNKHPQPADMKAAFETVMHGSLTAFFSLLNKEGTL